MADNTLIDGVTPFTVQDTDKSGAKVQNFALDIGEGTTKSLVSASNPLPVTSADQIELQTTALLYQQECDNPAWGSAGPIQQHEKEQPDYPAAELLTFDTNLHNILGSQNLVSDDRQKLKTENYLPPNRRILSKLNATNAECMMALNGEPTVIFQIGGSWTTYIYFYGSMDNGASWVGWGSKQFAAISSNTVFYTTGNGVWVTNTTGLTHFKVQMTTYATGPAIIQMCASWAVHPHLNNIYAQVQGVQSVLAAQRYSPYELVTSDSALREIFYVPEAWNSNIIYSPGDVVTFRGRIYRCVTTTATATSAYYGPTNTSYWTVDYRPDRTLAQCGPQNDPALNRLRVETNFNDYSYRMQEQQTLLAQLQIQNQMMYHDAELSVMQAQGGMYGKSFAFGGCDAAYYVWDEVR